MSFLIEKKQEAQRHANKPRTTKGVIKGIQKLCFTQKSPSLSLLPSTRCFLHALQKLALFGIEGLILVTLVVGGLAPFPLRLRVT